MLKAYRLIEGRMAEAQDGQGDVLLFISPTDEEKRSLIAEHGLDEHTLMSALDPDELARLEFEPNHFAMILKRPRNYSSKDHFLFRTSSMGMFLFKEKLILVSTEDVPLFEGRVFSRVNSLIHLALKLIYRSIFHFLEHLRVINMITDSLEQKINTSMENKYLLNLFTLEKSLVFYVSAINSNSMLIEKLRMNADKIGLSPEDRELLDDILIENNQCSRQAEIYSNILASLMDARASIVSNNLNILMKTLNIITIGIMVPTFVVSTFSMNVEFPLREHPYAFWLIMGMGFISVIMFLWIWTFADRSRRNGRARSPAGGSS